MWSYEGFQHLGSGGTPTAAEALEKASAATIESGPSGGRGIGGGPAPVNESAFGIPAPAQPIICHVNRSNTNAGAN
jgi:hypothetical protein